MRSIDELTLCFDPTSADEARRRDAFDDVAADLLTATNPAVVAYREVLVAALRHLADYCMDPADLPYEYRQDRWRRRDDRKPPPPPTARELLILEVGSQEDLLTLTAEPLPNEMPDLAVVRDGVRGRLQEAIAFADPVVLRLFGPEFQTAVRRLLVDAALTEPGIFTRPGRTDTIGAGAALAVAEAHRLAGRGNPMPVSSLAAHFGVRSSPQSRSNTLRNAIKGTYGWGSRDLPPRYLTAERRAVLIARRDALEPEPA